MKRKILAFVLIAVLLIGTLFYLYLFRSEVVNNPVIGVTTYYYSWGRPARVTVDSNWDGRTDFLGEIAGPFGAYASHTTEMTEFWEDRDYDGHFELHALVDNTDPFCKSRIIELEVDDDGDGKYERLLRDEEAREYYRRLTTKDSVE